MKGRVSVKHAVILHTIQDAEHCIQQGLHQTYKLFSTDVHVSCYLRHHYELESRDLCSYLEAQTVREIQADTIKSTNKMLEELDRQIAPIINQQLDLSMRYFTPLYALTAARQSSLYMLLAICIERMLSKYSFDTILVYDARLGPLNGDVELFLSSLFPEARFRFIRYLLPEKPASTRISNIRLQDMTRFLREENQFRRYFKKINPKEQGNETEKGALLFEPLSRRDVLTRASAGYSFNPWEDIIPLVFAYELSRKSMPELTALTEAIPSETERQKTVLSLLYQNINDEFCGNVMQYLQVVNVFRQLTKGAAISDAYWEVPPFKGAGALLNEYCMTSQGITVTGVQGQAAFFVGQTSSPFIPVSVLNRCHRYLTQGGTKEGSEMLYPSSNDMPEILVPAAKEANIKKKPRPEKRKPADVAVYLTPASSFSKTGQVSMHIPAQEKLLKFLDEQHGNEIHVVAYSIPDVEHCAMLPLLKTLKNIRLIYNATQETYLKKYAPKLILMDTPTPYLQDVLSDDVQVIVMDDEAVVFGDEVMEMLKQQVYYADELIECKRLLKMHWDGRLPSKRNGSYIKKFVVR